MILKKRIKRIIRIIVSFYEIHVAPFIASHFAWLLWPIYKIIKMNRICFVTNVIPCTGHIIMELDHFFHMLKNGQIDQSKRYIWVTTSNKISKGCVKFYKKKFVFATASYILYELTLPLLMAYEDLTVDRGLSLAKYAIEGIALFSPNISKYKFLSPISMNVATNRWNKYYSNRKKMPEYFPLRQMDVDHTKSDLYNFLNGDINKLVLIHLKDKASNATALPIDPITYVDSIHFLHKLGYTLVFAGRESMPEIFKDLNLINYSGSKIASFENDIILFHLAQFAITGSSGITSFADCFGMPYLTSNFWHLADPTFSDKCIFIPTIIKDKTGNYLTFAEQIQLELNHYHEHETLKNISKRKSASDNHLFQNGSYFARNATSDEILEGVKELLLMTKNLSQKNDKQSHQRRSPLYYSEIRCSEYFLNKHPYLL